jgi:hypothetical protein
MLYELSVSLTLSIVVNPNYYQETKKHENLTGNTANPGNAVGPLFSVDFSFSFLELV